MTGHLWMGQSLHFEKNIAIHAHIESYRVDTKWHHHHHHYHHHHHHQKTSLPGEPSGTQWYQGIHAKHGKTTRKNNSFSITYWLAEKTSSSSSIDSNSFCLTYRKKYPSSSRSFGLTYLSKITIVAVALAQLTEQKSQYSSSSNWLTFPDLPKKQ